MGLSKENGVAVSFVVPAHNEEVLLPDCLASIHRVAAGLALSYEIVVADDGSTDGTAAAAERDGARVVRVGHRQIAATRNSGARAARGGRLIFVDADTRVGEEVVRAALAALDGGAVGGGAAFEFDGEVPPYARLGASTLMRVFRRLRLAAGCFVFATREAFLATGGFDERYFAGEELFFSRAMKRIGRFEIVPHAVTTSGRKVRAYSGWTHLRTILYILVRGPKAVQRREGMELWYEDERRGQAARSARPRPPRSDLDG